MATNASNEGPVEEYPEMGQGELEEHGLFNIYRIGTLPGNEHASIDLAPEIADSLPTEGLIVDLGLEGDRRSMPVTIFLPEGAVPSSTSVTIRISHGPTQTAKIKSRLQEQDEHKGLREELEKAREVIANQGNRIAQLEAERARLKTAARANLWARMLAHIRQKRAERIARLALASMNEWNWKFRLELARYMRSLNAIMQQLLHGGLDALDADEAERVAEEGGRADEEGEGASEKKEASEEKEVSEEKEANDVERAGEDEWIDD